MYVRVRLIDPDSVDVYDASCLPVKNGGLRDEVKQAAKAADQPKVSVLNTFDTESDFGEKALAASKQPSWPF